ncbi:PaaI family thioesterase [Bombilactobacillus folatiphilus]|uniref:PaaI family thioesterase n=1 Tax=Bombilactobacillus folatiphilus TaxID=2923362 RepID=A0ABY4P8K4_9LACO|nr:PaaI family thioesterase [Bombilactobacillus folatiphilus]UQS81977.1 PaaI family thioesterase [Bombilactobacillus folatiphilus]
MNLIQYLNIQTVQQQVDCVQLKLMVTPQVCQPFGQLHGGINSVLAETAASMGANLNLPAHQVAVGTQLQTNHLRSVTEGELFVQATPIQRGSRLQVWQAVTYQQARDQPTSLSTVTLLAVDNHHSIK